MTSGARVVEVGRQMSREAATALVGADVEPAEPTVTTATIAVDPEAGEPVYAYLPLGDVAALRRAVLALGQTKETTRTFGYRARRPVFGREGCGVSTLAAQEPAAHAVLDGFSDRLAGVLADIDPRLVDRGRDAAAVVEPEWRLGESRLWTSGVVNASARLPYHRDAFNLPAWSAMPVLRRHMTGGHLVIPEYGATIACRDGWGVFFAGYDLLHGVTPMRLTRPDGYRYSVVYYALKGMKDCFTAAMETAYARRRRTERERDIAARLAVGDDVIPGSNPGSVPLEPGRGHGGRRMGRQDAATGERRHNLPGGRGGKSPRQMGGRPVLTGRDDEADPGLRSGLRKGRGGGGRQMGGRPVADGREPRPDPGE